jgi:hypothetical protein
MIIKFFDGLNSILDQAIPMIAVPFDALNYGLEKCLARI